MALAFSSVARGVVRRFSSAAASVQTKAPLVTYEQHGKVGVLTLNDPARLNPLTVPMGEALAEAIGTIDYSKTGAVIVTGAGKAFSAGGDLAFLNARACDTPLSNTHTMRKFYGRYLGALRQLPVPTLAAINGSAVGAGLCFALGADLRIAAKSARMGVTFVGLGLHPGMGATYNLPKLIGPQLASRLILTGELIDAAEAARIGLVLETVEDAECLPRAIALAEKIASQSPVAVRGAVRSLRMLHDDGLDRALWREADAQAGCYAGPDLKEGVAAVAGKRKPTWTQYDSF